MSGAKRVSLLSYALTFVSFLGCSAVMYLKLKYLTSILSDLPEILHKVSYKNTLKGSFSLTLCIALAFIPDAMKYSQIGILKALGIQEKGIFSSFIGNWVCNLSLFYVTISRLNFGLHGIWISKFVADLYILIANTFLINSEDWHRISEDFYQKRNDKGNDQFSKIEE